MKLTFWKQFFERLTKKSPEFFVKIQNWAIGAVASFTAIYVALAALPPETFVIPDWLTKVYSYVVVAGVVLGVVAKTTVKNPDELKK